MALAANPVLRGVRSETGAASGRLRQAGLPLNPEVSVETEDFVRRSAGGSSQTTLGMAQTFRLWGKRGAEREAACAELAASQWEVQTLILDLYRQTAGGFAILLGAEQNLTYAEDRFRLAQEIESAVGVKVSEGAVPKAELLRAQASTALARVERGGHRQITTTEIYERVSDQDLPRAINRA